MKAWRREPDDRGVTLIELMVVLAIIGILAVVGAFQYVGWRTRYQVESDIKQVYTDFMSARAMALSRSRMFFLYMPASDPTRYYVYEDTFDKDHGTPEGDQKLETANDKKITDGQTTHALTPSSTQLSINSKGMITDSSNNILLEPEYIHIATDNTVDPDYDCLELAATRIKMGLWNGTASTCTTK